MRQAKQGEEEGKLARIKSKGLADMQNGAGKTVSSAPSFEESCP